MGYHVSLAGQAEAACGTAEPADQVVPLEEALGEGGRHFTCVACLKVLTGGRKHSRPEEAGQ